jgi:hypothetical protein
LFAILRFKDCKNKLNPLYESIEGERTIRRGFYSWIPRTRKQMLMSCVDVMFLFGIAGYALRLPTFFDHWVYYPLLPNLRQLIAFVLGCMVCVEVTRTSNQQIERDKHWRVVYPKRSYSALIILECVWE